MPMPELRLYECQFTHSHLGIDNRFPILVPVNSNEELLVKVFKAKYSHTLNRVIYLGRQNHPYNYCNVIIQDFKNTFESQFEFSLMPSLLKEYL